MTDAIASFAVAASGMRSQAERLRHISENVANADTPGYRRKTASFEPDPRATAAEGEVRLGKTQLDRQELARIYDPGHPLADDDGYHDGSNVDLVVEIADAREAQRSYEANLRMFNQARQMSSAVLDLLRR